MDAPYLVPHFRPNGHFIYVAVMLTNGFVQRLPVAQERHRRAVAERVRQRLTNGLRNPSDSEIREYFKSLGQLWLDELYLRHISTDLERLRQKHAHTFNSDCPFCRARNAHYFPKHDRLMFKCYGCQETMPFSTVLKRLVPALYAEYVIDSNNGRLREDSPVATNGGR